MRRPGLPVGRAAALACAALALACSPARPAEFRIGLLGYFDGIDSLASGEPARAGARLAVEEINATGGVVIDGVRHTVVLRDRRIVDRPDDAASVARALINLDSIDVLVGPQYSEHADAAGAVAEAAEIPMIAPMASAPDVTRGRAFVHRLAYVNAVQGRVLARFARDSLRLRRVGMLRMAASEYGRGLAEDFATEFRRVGGTVDVDAIFDADDPRSRATAVAQVLRARPDGVVLLTLEGADTTDLRRLRAGGYRGQLLGSDYWDAPALEGNRDVRGAIMITNWDLRLDLPATRAFRRAYDARHPGERPRATAAASYDAVMLLAAAASRAGERSGPRVAAALRTSGEHAGAFGVTRFVGGGDPVRGGVILEMVGDSSRIRAVVPPAP